MIHVCSLARLQDTVEATGARHVISLINAQTVVTLPASVDRAHHLFLGINDVLEETEGLVAPDMSHVRDLLDFVAAWPRQAPLVIHCYAGISRSTAAAYTAVCALRPDLDEAEIARHLRHASPTATPNARIVALADQVMGRHGRMNRAISAIGRGRDAYAGEPFSLSLLSGLDPHAS